MSAEQSVDHSVEQEARSMGWVPKEEFKGAEDRWVDAEQFVENGRKILPIVKSTNKRLIENQTALQRELADLRRQLEARDQDLKTFQEFHNEEVTRRVEETRAQLKAGIKQAREDQDVDRELDLTEKLTQLNTPEPEPEPEPEPQAPALTNDFLAWRDQNRWFEQDAARTYEAMAIATKLRAERPDLVNQAFYQELDRRLAGEPAPKTSKVEGSRGGGTSSTGRTYADLPSEAKKQCDKWADKFVKPDGKFKTKDEYRKHFIEELEATGYFQ